jgi:hypothetical protein
LYVDVVLHSEIVSSFCSTISGSSDLARRVQRLSIQLSNDFANMDALAHALHTLSNLQALEINCPQHGPWEDVVLRPLVAWEHCTAARILHGCPFRLKVFRSGFTMTEADFVMFLSQQPELEELVTFDLVGDVVTLEPQMLPRLRKFKSGVARLAFGNIPGESARDRVFQQERMDITLRLLVLPPYT